MGVILVTFPYREPYVPIGIVVRWESKNEYHEDTCLKVIELLLQVLSSIVLHNSEDNGSMDSIKESTNMHFRQVIAKCSFLSWFCVGFIIDNLLMQHKFCCVYLTGRRWITCCHTYRITHTYVRSMEALLFMRVVSSRIWSLVQEQKSYECNHCHEVVAKA